MIAFASAIREPDAYRSHARRGIDLAAEADSQVEVLAATGSFCRSHNLLLDRAARHDDLEALVIVDEDAEIIDPGFCAKVRHALADPDVGLVGSVGARGVAGLAWWDGAVNAGHVRHRYREHGGGEIDAYAWARAGVPPAEVDMVDGFLLVLSPWAVRSLRFDERLHLGIGFDLDFAAQVRTAGRKVVTADLHVIHHRALELVEDEDVWIEAHVDVAEKYDGHLPGAPPRPDDWKQRARRAEAERDAARALSYSTYSRREAELVPLERELAAMTATLGWRLTTPLRVLNAWRRERGRDGSPRAR